MEGDSLRATGSHVKQMPHKGLCKESGVLTPYPCKPEQMVCGVSALGGHGTSLGGVGRSAHQMTSYPSIDFFL